MSLITLLKIRRALELRPAELAAERASGRKVAGLLDYNIPEELLHACGVIPLRIARGGDNPLAERGGNLLSTQNCCFLQQSIASLTESAEPLAAQLDLVLTDTTCVQLHRAATLIPRLTGKPVMHLGFPKDPALPAGRRYYAAEIRHLASQLEASSGIPLEAERLEAAVSLQQQIADTVRALYAALWAPHSALRWSELQEALQAGFVLDRRVFLTLLRELLNEVENAASPDEDPHVRLLLAGSPIMAGDRKLTEIVEASGARIVGDLLWSGYAPYAELHWAGSTLDDIAEAHLNSLPHAGQHCMDMHSDRRLLALEALARQTRAQGVIYYALRYCDPFSFKTQATREWMKRSNVRLLEAHTDYATMDTESLRTRVEAFVEMLDA